MPKNYKIVRDLKLEYNSQNDSTVELILSAPTSKPNLDEISEKVKVLSDILGLKAYENWKRILANLRKKTIRP